MFRKLNDKIESGLTSLNQFKHSGGKKNAGVESPGSPTILLKIATDLCPRKNGVPFALVQGQLSLINPKDTDPSSETHLPDSLERRLTPSQCEAADWHEKEARRANESIRNLVAAYSKELDPEKREDMDWILNLVAESELGLRQMRSRVELMKEAMQESAEARDIRVLVNHNAMLIQYHIDCLAAWKEFAAEKIRKMDSSARMAERIDSFGKIGRKMTGLGKGKGGQN